MGHYLGIFHLQEGFRAQKICWSEIRHTSKEHLEIAHVMHVEGEKAATF